MCVSSMSATVAAAVCLDSSIAVLVARCSSSSVRVDRRLGGFGDALGAFLHLAERARDRGGRGQAGVVDQAGDLVALVHHGLGEDEALGVDRLHRLVGGAADFAGEFLALVGQGHEQRIRALVEHARHLVDALRHGGVDLIGLADDIARHLGAHADQLALGLGRVLPDRFIGGRGALDDRVAQRAGAAIERNRRFRGAAIECFGRCGRRHCGLAKRFGRIGASWVMARSALAELV